MVLDFKALEPLLRWENAFHTEYYRKRNSRAKTKNLRCFPGCCAVHNPNGFCGRAAVVSLEDFPGVLKKLNIYSKYSAKNLSARAMFLTEDQYNIWCKRKDIICVEKEQLFYDMRGTVDPRLPFIPVEVNHFSESYITFRINPQLLGWHYSWRSNKSTADTKHVLALFVYIRLENESRYTLLGVSSSPTFLVSSGKVSKEKICIKEEKCIKRKSPGREHILGFESVEPGVVLTQPKVETELFKKFTKGYSTNSQKTFSKSMLLQNIGEAKEGLLNQANANETKEVDDYYLSMLFEETEDYWGRKKARHETPDMSSPYKMHMPTESYESSSSEEFSADTTDLSFIDNDQVKMSDAEVIWRITESLKGEKFAENISKFFQECYSGYFGSSLCEMLMKDDCDALVNNSFVKDVLSSIFNKFKTVVGNSISSDLYDEGLVSEPSTKGAALVFCSSILGKILGKGGERPGILQFLKLLKRHYSSSDMNRRIHKTEFIYDSFAQVNKCWVCVDNTINIWFVDIMSKKLGLLNSMCASLFAKICSQITLHADHEMIRIQTMSVATYFWSQNLMFDNQAHELRDPKPLLPYIVKIPNKLYKARQFYNDAGIYTGQWLTWYRYSDVFSVDELEKRNLNGCYVCIFKEATIHADKLIILKRVFHVKKDVRDVSLETWKKINHQDLVAEVTSVYQAT